MARARSASTSPSAPSATCASVSGWPACNNAAVDLAIMEIAQAAEQRGVDLGGRQLRAVHPGENLLVGNLEPGLVFIELGVAQLRDMRIGKAAEHQIHLANAAVPGAEQQPPPARVQPIARNIGSGHRVAPTPKTRTGPGGVYIEGLRGAVSVCFAQPSSASAEPASQHVPMRPDVLNHLFASLTSLPGVGPKLEQLYARLLEHETPRVVDLLFHLPAGVIDRRARPKLHEVQPGQVVTVEVMVEEHRPAPPHRPRAPYRIIASDGSGPTLTLTFFNARKDYLEKLLPVGETRYVSGTAEFYDGMLQMVHPDRVVDEQGFASLPLVEPVYPLTEGLAPGNVRRAMEGALARLPELPEWQDEAWIARERFPGFAATLRHLHRPAEPHDIAPESLAWTRLAYDELLAGQLALALVRAHMRRQAGRNADELASIEAVDDGVSLLTAHSAKGLEWPVVILSGCIDARWPGRVGGSPSALTLPGALVPELPPPGEAVIDEERRLFYVAVPRARDRLVLSRARRYPRSFRDEAPSPFLGPVAAGDGVRSRDVPRAASLHPRKARVSGRPTAERLSLGVSDLRIFKQCPRRFEYRRRYHMPVRDSLQSWYGTLMHTVLQNAAVRRIAGEAVGADRVAAIWRDAWAVARGPKGSNPELRALGEQQLRRYVGGPAWLDASIEAVEENFSLALDHADVHGRWDRLDDAGGTVTVADYKTGSPRDEERLRKDLQVRAYAVAVSRRDRSDAVAVELHHLQTAEVTRVEFTREQLDTSFRHLSVTARDMAAVWRDGDFPPHPSAFHCPRCEYRTVCDEGRAIEAG